MPKIQEISNNQPPSKIQHLRKYKWDLVWLLVYTITSFSLQLFNYEMKTVYDLTIQLDYLIPFLPETFIVYHLWAPGLLAFGFLLFMCERRLYHRYIFSLMLGNFLGTLTFPLFQTIVTPRIAVEKLVQEGSGLFNEIARWTHSNDNHFCGFPSIHVTTCMVLLIVLLISRRQLWLKISLGTFYVLVIISTLTTKQHVFWDVPGGLLYGTIAFFLTKPICNFYFKKFWPEEYDLLKQ